MNRIRRILHPSDFSRASTAAFARAVDMARMNRAELLIIHVLAPFVPFGGTVTNLAYQEIEARARAQAKKDLNGLVAKARRAGARARGFLMEGVPYDRILRTARSRRADLLVLGTHGRTALTRFFLGSVAGRVVARAKCPVLTVRGK